MQGQISDGYWENTRPYNHWHVWCDLKWDDVLVDPENVGIDFYANKRNYSFNNKFLNDIVAERVILKINLWKKFGDDFLNVLKHNHWLIPDDGVIYESDDEYWVKKKTNTLMLGITNEVMKDCMENGEYTLKDYRKDCAALSKVFKTDKNEN